MVEIRTRETSHGGKSVTVFKNGEPTDFKPNIPKMPAPPPRPKEHVTSAPRSEITARRDNDTSKAVIVNRVAKRLGWVTIDNPEETIKQLTEEAEKMKENVYKYLESLVKLGKKFCHEKNPECIKCPMKTGCRYRTSEPKKRGLFKK